MRTGAHKKHRSAFVPKVSENTNLYEAGSVVWSSGYSENTNSPSMFLNEKLIFTNTFFLGQKNWGETECFFVW